MSRYIHLLWIVFFSTGCLPSKMMTSKDWHLNHALSLPSKKNVYWYHLGRPIEGTLALNQNLNTVIHLYGKDIHLFLNDDENNKNPYCLIIDFDHGTAKKQLRMRAYPDSFVDKKKNFKEYFFRLDIHLEEENRFLCSGTLQEISDTDAAFAISNTCPDCTNIIQSKNISLYSTREVLDDSRIVPTSELNLNPLSMRIDPGNNILDPDAGCTDDSCSSRGFDCCLNGQCVKDGIEKPHASSVDNYAAIIEKVRENPKTFIDYPQVYFVCGMRRDEYDFLHEEEVGAGHLEDDIANYRCLSSAKQDPSDYSQCHTSSLSGNEQAFKAIRQSVWSQCGCRADPFPDDPDDPRCPDFYLTAELNESGDIISIHCRTPIVERPIHNREVYVSARSIPHRFFKKSDGSSVDDINGQSNLVQEGDEFFYIDEIQKTVPNIEMFGMNSILGPIDISLEEASPAKMVPVEYNQSYLISVDDGIYIPCPDCPKDNWNQSLSGHPVISNGYGLQPSKSISNRSIHSDHFLNGNYEDTLFGRACWLPPTMIPFSHKEPSLISYSSTQNQRLDRLKMQAAFWANGYQRDWFGFNKGALIGSFDGVRWFAIGQGRSVTSRSTKLFLAVNAPFADLADSTVFKVSIRTLSSGNTPIDHDYDPRFTIDDARQNQGATCQSFHQCEKDSDCITQLGWEYICTDISSWKAYWPQFDIYGNEEINKSRRIGFANLLQNGLSSGDNKRCVYRGSGALCRKNFETLTSRNTKKLFQCAPNFYCHTDMSSINGTTARSTQGDERLLFGLEADFLGRPLHYVGGNESLPSPISSIFKNAASQLYDPLTEQNTNDWGICRPGKRIIALDPSDPNRSIVEQQHSQKDNENRTDFISQISSCNADATGDSRTMSCPSFEMDENNSRFGEYLTSNSLSARRKQNSCSKESISSGTSAFEEIEATLSSPDISISQETLADHSCLRRAGSICHTDLNCTPNRLHYEQTFFLGMEHFGETLAEYDYWTEYLVCGQPSDPSSDFNLRKNRCCRETGKTLTMHTQSRDDDLVFDSSNTSLVVNRYPANNPSASNRYSRYSIVEPINQSPGNRSHFEIPRVETNTTPSAYQWKTLNETGSLSCCGGGFIRQFSDNNPSWAKNRLHLDEEKFSCLNYQTELPLLSLQQLPRFDLDVNSFRRDYDKFCLSPGEINNDSLTGPLSSRSLNNGGCIQVPLETSPNFHIANPRNLSNADAVMDTTPIEPDGNVQQDTHAQSPFMPVGLPIPWYNNNDLNHFFARGVNPRQLSLRVLFRLPFYVGRDIDNFNPASTRFRYCWNNDQNERECNNPLTPLPTASLIQCANILTALQNNITDRSNPLTAGFPDDHHCIFTFNNIPVFYAQVTDPMPMVGTTPANWRGGVRLSYHFPNTRDYEYGDGNLHREWEGLMAGNALYYLSRLGRFELTGIPQVFYEPLYCNTNRGRLVSDLFDLDDHTRSEFEDSNFSFDYDETVNNVKLQEIYNSRTAEQDDSLKNVHNGTQVNKIVFLDKLKLSEIFSGHKFRCCKKLGAATLNSADCCSNFAQEEGDNFLYCRLQQGTNLNVYLNRFISSEGTKNDEWIGFEDSDFIPLTGELKLQHSTYDKLVEFGHSHCENRTIRKGSAFGRYYGQPSQGRYEYSSGNTPNDLARRFFSMVDSLRDADNDGNSRNDFKAGYRWNHHYYCE